ncbi:MAG: hypothetical protein IH840_02750 [Candidatus Heimdallarchaeota archaeon]|nr:hypothetical protein [Candidatus Heimdallarchaeota archaeon]
METEERLDLHSQLYLALTKLGIEPTMESLPDRKRIQKLVYLLKIVGIDFGFEYNWHIHGPYSPQVTKNMFDIFERNFRIDYSIKLGGDREHKINSLRTRLGKLIYSVDELELITSMIFLKKTIGVKKGFKREVSSLLRLKKPHFKDTHVKNRWKLVAEIEKIA